MKLKFNHQNKAIEIIDASGMTTGMVPLNPSRSHDAALNLIAMVNSLIQANYDLGAILKKKDNQIQVMNEDMVIKMIQVVQAVGMEIVVDGKSTGEKIIVIPKSVFETPEDTYMIKFEPDETNHSVTIRIKERNANGSSPPNNSDKGDGQKEEG